MISIKLKDKNTLVMIFFMRFVDFHEYSFHYDVNEGIVHPYINEEPVLKL